MDSWCDLARVRGLPSGGEQQPASRADHERVRRLGRVGVESSTINNPEKKAKHLKSFAFYEGDNQVYRKELACSIQQCLKDLDSGNDIVEINRE